MPQSHSPVKEEILAAMKVYPITPVPAPRMTQSDRWKKRPCVMRYFAFRDEVKLHKVELPDCSHVVFILPMPPSWSNKKRDENFYKPHRQKPDIDNLGKALLDSIFKDDGHVSDIRLTKLWGDIGEIRIISPLPDEEFSVS